MRKFMGLMLVLAMVFVFGGSALASPWLACDAYAPTDIQPQYFYVTLDAGTPVKVTHTVDPLGWKLYDLVNVTTGNHQAKVKACISSTEWGEACSTEVPFDFVRPAPAKVPAGIRLIK